MKTPLKLFLTLALVALLAFCGFGFLATFEPNPPTTQWTFRIAYGAFAVVALLALTKIWRRPPAKLR